MTIGEFKEALHAHSDMPDEEIIKIFESLDMDHTGVIKYTEFLAAAMQEQLYLAEDKILEAFNKLDLDHTTSELINTKLHIWVYSVMVYLLYF